MDYSKIVSNKVIRLPIMWNNDYFPHEIERILTAYIDLLQSSNFSSDKIEVIKTFQKSMELTVTQYYEGKPALAYESFNDGMKIISMYLSKYIVAFKNIYKNETSLYRARVNVSTENSKEYSNDDMFHIPFQLRGKVESQRYSISGLPCLYLGESSYVCWLELGKPNLDNISVALVRSRKSSKDISILDLSMLPHQIEIDAIEDYLMIWPLIALCSICAKQKDNPFKPEYIIPQLLMQWIQRRNSEKVDKVDGIRYFTVAFDTDEDIDSFNNSYLYGPHLYRNIVFPVQNIKPEGKCDYLEERFEITKNISGKALQFFRNAYAQNWNEYPEIQKPYIVVSNTKLEYENTLFQSIEQALKDELEGVTPDFSAIITKLTNEGFYNHIDGGTWDNKSSIYFH